MDHTPSLSIPKRTVNMFFRIMNSAQHWRFYIRLRINRDEQVTATFDTVTNQHVHIFKSDRPPHKWNPWRRQTLGWENSKASDSCITGAVETGKSLAVLTQTLCGREGSFPSKNHRSHIWTLSKRLNHFRGHTHTHTHTHSLTLTHSLTHSLTLLHTSTPRSPAPPTPILVTQVRSLCMNGVLTPRFEWNRSEEGCG